MRGAPAEISFSEREMRERDGSERETETETEGVRSDHVSKFDASSVGPCSILRSLSSYQGTTLHQNFERKHA